MPAWALPHLPPPVPSGASRNTGRAAADHGALSRAVLSPSPRWTGVLVSVITDWFCLFLAYSGRFLYMEAYDRSSSAAGLFHWAKLYQGSSMLWHVSELGSFLWLSNIPLYAWGYFKSSWESKRSCVFSMHFLKNPHVLHCPLSICGRTFGLSPLRAVVNMPPWTLACRFLWTHFTFYIF